MRTVPVCLLVWPDPPPNAVRTVQYPGLVRELLAEAGLPVRELMPGELPSAPSVMLTVGDGALDRDAMAGWLESGGAWVAVGGACGCADLFGVEPEQPAWTGWGGGVGLLGEGYLEPGDLPGAQPGDPPLHLYGGVAVRSLDRCAHVAGVLDCHGGPTGRTGLARRKVGQGSATLIAADLTGSVARIRQGTAVTRDAPPAPDGSAPLCDGVLKSDDGMVLDWIMERTPVPGAPGLGAFLHAAADRWCDLLVAEVLAAARRVGVVIPIFWPWPNGLPAIGLLSHDTDGNDPGSALELVAVLRDLGVPGTWCVVLPGYPREVLEAIRAGGHELAMHFDAMTPGTTWSGPAFRAQHAALAALFGDRPPTTNKNHYLRWEGDTDLFEWCVRCGIRVDQTKGATKTGGLGWLFGTCRAYRPIDPSGHRLPVLEVTTPTQDLEVFAPACAATPLLGAALRHHGIHHLLFHPAHIGKPGVADALRAAVRAGTDAGLEWWTCRQLADWDAARRAARLCVAEATPGLRLENAPVGATVLLPGGAGYRVDGKPVATTTIEVYGQAFAAVVAGAGSHIVEGA